MRSLETDIVGIGDDIIATGMARGAAARGKRIAFGDGQKIKWGPHSPMVFKNNPNIASPGSEHKRDLEWVHYYKGNRIYNRGGAGKWIWNYGFKTNPGEFFFSENEEWRDLPDDLILIEPNVPNKPCAINKQWPVKNFEKVAGELGRKFTVRQFSYGGSSRICAEIETQNFRRAAALLKKARLAILPEGGLHHAAAAVGTPSVVLFGGFAPPAILGYESHVNLVGSDEFCGSYTTCQHCIAAMQSISIDSVLSAAESFLR